MSNSKKFWDRMAKNYDQGVNEDDQDGRRIVGLTEKYLKLDSVVLDFGCATGKFSFELAHLVKELYGMDISSEMIRIAREIAHERNLTNLHFSQGTLDDIHLEKNSLDAIFAFNILHLLTEPHKSIQKFHQLLKPGGVLISATASLGKNGSILGFVLKPLSKLGLVPHINFFQTSEVEKLITAANFEILETQMISISPANIFLAARKN